MQVLAGDIGGTSTRLWIAQSDGRTYRRLHAQHYASQRYSDFDSILQEFLLEHDADRVEAACFGVAGPIIQTERGETCKVTNLPWEMDSHRLLQTLKIPRVRLINDFQAIGFGIEALQADDVVVLQTGIAARHAPRAVLGAGTGLGQGILVWQNDHYEAIATEGGHVEFGPADELQLALARYLQKTEGHASYELILSGSGLVRLYRFLRDQEAVSGSPHAAPARQVGDDAAEITRAAFERHDPLATRTVKLFVRIYGAQAGNLALTAGATGGVYIAGGIAPKLLPALQDGTFVQAFRNKYTMADYVAEIPVTVVTNESVGLIGATVTAARLMSR